MFKDSILILGLLISLSRLSLAANSLPSFNISPSTASVAGVSSGGFMAVQLHVAYSGSFPAGAAIFAGGPYWCAQGSTLTANLKCMSTYEGLPAPSDSVSVVKQWESSGEIDSSALLAHTQVYLFSGTLDGVVHQGVMNALRDFYTNYMSPNQIHYENQIPAAHGWISPDALQECSIYSPPFLNNCGMDPEGTYLSQFYGALHPRSTALRGQVIQFDQSQFVSNRDAPAIDMDNIGFAYVPESCSRGEACRVHVALHACQQSYSQVGTRFVDYAGINEWADSNGIVVLYPQALPALNNPEGCWDWWGYTGNNYAKKAGFSHS